VRGRLIVFEGGEGAGKSTQLQRLAARLTTAGVRHAVFREPGGTPLGDRIREILLHAEGPMAPAAEASLFIASRAQLVAMAVRPALDAGTHVLLDRFLLSTYAYQIHGRGLDEAAVRAANQLAVQGMAPDLTLLLQVPVGEGLARATARGAADRMERSARDFHERVATAFELFATPAWQRAHPECGPIVGVPGADAPDRVESRALDALRAHVPDLVATAGVRA
jgi:dTMP kinase